MFNEEIYPVTAQFEKELKDLNSLEAFNFGKLIVKIMSEYEHGSADIDILFEDLKTVFHNNVYLKVYAAIMTDMIMAVDVMLSEEL